MARKPLFYCIFFILMCVRATSTRANVISFVDGTFNIGPTAWTLTPQYTGPSNGSASATHQPTGGHDADYRQVVVNVGNLANDATYAFSLNNQAIYTPSSQGAITAFNFNIDRNTDATGQEYGPAVQQDGILYYAYSGSGSNNSTWTTMATPQALTSAGFVTPNSSTTHPNFSATGDQLIFGFMAAQNTLTNGGFSATAGYDNWVVNLTTTGVPEPATLALVPLIALCLGRHRSRV